MNNKIWRDSAPRDTASSIVNKLQLDLKQSFSKIYGRSRREVNKKY